MIMDEIGYQRYMIYEFSFKASFKSRPVHFL